MDLTMSMIPFVAFILLIKVHHSVGVATCAVDLGNEFIKIGIVQPGVPMEIALDRDSQRKTATIVYIRNGERLFGDAAVNMAVRFPANGFRFLPSLVGKNINHPVVQQYMKDFPFYNLKENDQNQLTFKIDDNLEYTVEELLAMIIQNSVESAEIFAESPLKGIVLTVPPFFGQTERLAILRVAEIAGVSILQLINDNSAVGLNFGIFRRNMFNTTVQYYMFYDLGSTYTTASIVAYQIKENIEYGMKVEEPQMTIVGLGYDDTLGTTQFILRLRDHLAKAFNDLKKTKTDITTVPRAMAKLYKEATRVMKVLSANNDIYAQIENVMEDIDFKVKVTRTEFEDMCKDLFGRSAEPVYKAMESAQIPSPNIQEVILMGGGTRIPKVQEMLMSVTRKTELGKSINTDEAAALGAVYQAAYLTPGFKVKNFFIKDAVFTPFAAEFDRVKKGSSGESTKIQRILYPKLNGYPSRKSLTFNKHTSNFGFNITLLQSDPSGDYKQAGFNDVMYAVQLDNVTETYKKYESEPLVKNKGLKVHFLVDDSGIFRVTSVEALLERSFENTTTNDTESTLQKLGKKISNLFGSDNDKKDETDSKNNKTEDSKDNNTTEASNQTTSNAPPSPVQISEAIKFSMKWLLTTEPTEESMEESIKKIKSLRAADLEKLVLEKSKNELESAIFESREKMYNDIYLTCSTESEREVISKLVEEINLWYEDQPFDTPKPAFDEQLTKLKSAFADLELRVTEVKLRPVSVKNIMEVLNASVYFHSSLPNLTAGVTQVFTQAEVDTLGRLINETTDWVKKTNETIAAMDLTKNPSIRADDFQPHIGALQREVAYLINKLTIWKNKPPPEPEPIVANATSATNATSDTEKDNNVTIDSVPPLSDTDTKSKATDSGGEAVKIEATTEKTSTEDSKSTDRSDL